MKLTIAIQAADRPWMLKRTLPYLLRAVSRLDASFRVRVEVWDDGFQEDSPALISWVWPYFLKWGPVPSTKVEADRRCGEKRRRIVESFLRSNIQHDVLLLLDDDILIGDLTQPLADLAMLQSAHPRGHRIGGLAMHGGHSNHSEFFEGRQLFAQLNLTGEAAVFLTRAALEDAGNGFGPHRTGYADTQWEAFRRRSWWYVTRVNPPYSAQHLGLGDGSVIQHDWKPFWVTDAWRANTPGRPYLEVAGLDVPAFVRAANTQGCRAALDLLPRLENEMNHPTISGRPMRDDMPGTIGILRVSRLDLRHPERGYELVLEDRNTVVTNAFTQFARLLAGEAVTTRTVTHMKFGGGTTTPAITDTDLETPYDAVIKAITEITYPDARSVQFTAFLLDTELNGFPITEAGLLFASVAPRLAARKVFAEQNKSEDFQYRFDWVISWPVSVGSGS